MNYISSSEAAKKWNITRRRISVLATQGRIPGAVLVSSRWMIPENAAKPRDARNKQVIQNVNEDNTFHFRIYQRADDDSETSLLTDEEKKIKNIVNTCFACRFDELPNLYDQLPFDSKNHYNRIISYYLACMISFVLTDTYKFSNYYRLLSNEFKNEFPYKKEMEILYFELNATLGYFDDIVKQLEIDPTYQFHPDCLSHLSAVHLISLFYSDKHTINENDLKTYEINCSLLKNTSHSFQDLQTIHIYLALLNETKGNIKGKEYHLKEAFLLAEKYELYWLPAMQYFFMGNSFDPILETFDPKFVHKIKILSVDIQKRRELFNEKFLRNSIFTKLPKKKFLFVYYAAQKFTNKEIAVLLHISEKSVKRSFTNIYNALGIESRKELVEYYKESTRI